MQNLQDSLNTHVVRTHKHERFTTHCMTMQAIQRSPEQLLRSSEVALMHENLRLKAVQDGDLWMMACVSAIVLSVVLLFFRQLQLVSFDPVMAASIGIPVLFVDYVLTTCTSLVVVAGVNVVGVILVVGLLIIPAGTAYLLCDRLHRMMVVAQAKPVLDDVRGIGSVNRIDVRADDEF